MKKLLSVLAVLFVMGTTSVFALGIGAQGGYNPGLGGAGAAVTFKLNKLPYVFAADLNIAGGALQSVGITADMWLANPKIEGSWGYFYGIGLAAGLRGLSSNVNFGIGARAVLGTNVFVLKRALEFYLDVAWQPMFWFGGDWSTQDLLNFPINFGFRFWF